jgi:two-component system chemotaxis response regulator CheB
MGHDAGMTVETRDRFAVVALVSSAGGLDALTRVLAPLEPGFPAAVIALQHTAPDFESQLAQILDSRGMLPVRAAADNDPLVPGEVLVIPAGAHLLVGTDARVRLIKTGALPPARPSADLLLSTLAVALGPRAIAVVLTGGGTDGALGTQAIHAYGGTVLVQDEASSQQYGMPRATVDAGHPGTPIPLDHIAEALTTLLRS